MVKIPEGINQSIKNKINETAQEALGKLSITMEPTELYRELVNNEEIFQTFAKAAEYLPSVRLSLSPQFLRENLLVLIHIKPKKLGCYLVPSTGFNPTPESKIMQALELPNQVAANWQSTITLFNEFCNYDARVVGSFFPWLKDILIDCEWFKTQDTWERTNFKIRWGLEKINDKIIDQTIAQLIEGKPKRFPILTPMVSKACRLGKQLFAQATLLKDAPSHVGESNVVCVCGLHLLSPQLLNEIREIKDGWDDEEDQRNWEKINNKVGDMGRTR
jgi:hypothetical protein